jgi:hypothetical protein
MASHAGDHRVTTLTRFGRFLDPELRPLCPGGIPADRAVGMACATQYTARCALAYREGKKRKQTRWHQKNHRHCHLLRFWRRLPHSQH